MVSEAQFEMAISKAELGLSGPVVAALARHFKASTDSDAIDYLAFIKFASSRPRAISFVVEQLRNMMLRLTTVEVFRRFDEDGDGVVTRREFRRGLEELGFHLKDSASVTAACD